MGLPVGRPSHASTPRSTSYIVRMLREIRIEQNISIINLAVDLDLHESSLSDYERGIREPHILIIERWAKALRHELDLHPIGE